MKIKCTSKPGVLSIILIIVIIFPFFGSSQTVGEVLEVGRDHIINNRDKLLLKFSKGKIEYDLWDGSKTNFAPLKDSALFLSKLSSVNVYIRPLNPLNHFSVASNEFIPDQITQEESSAIDLIGRSIIDLTKESAVAKDKAKIAKDKAKKIADEKAKNKNKKKKTKELVEPEDTQPEDCSSQLDGLIAQLKNIETLLKKDQKKEINDLFKQLKSLSFEREQETKDEINLILSKIEPLQDHFNTLSTAINDLNEDITKYDCPNPHPFLVKDAFNNLVSKAENALKAQTTRYKNLKEVFEIVKKAYVKASSNDEGLKWMIEQAIKVDNNENEIEDNNIELRKGQISKFSVSINEGGYKLSEDGEIIVQEKKLVVKRLIRIRKFQRFIPEVTPGTAYTFLEFPKYKTTADASGNLVVADAGNENFKRVNFSAMINYNFFVPLSSINPFVQFGVGANTDYPAFFSGLGFRFNLGSKTIKALSLSGGIVSTWIKTLKTLEINKPVKGEAELEKDLQHEFKWPPKPYISFQIKL